MSTTENRDDPELDDIDPETGMQRVYLVLSEEERAKGFVRPVRRSYVHMTCGKQTTMGQEIAETYARNPHFYGGTYCATCRDHYPVGKHGQFYWADTKIKVGT